jgi:hypothetical protein
MADNQNQPHEDFQAFESLAKKLMKVPQHELREKIEEEKSKKDDRVIDEP